MTSPDQQTDAAPESGKLVLNSRAEFRDLLIRAGLARGAAEKLSRGGWSALAGETAEDDLERLLDEARSIAALLKDE